ncbi:choice-of-anchor X domain-containing protein [Chitinimonas sp.]|uniref:choice-of-anchor X domain-containing protein n=1 Tax=Chitinimonas sp. TaxID=1934313 RepID=UPI0035AF0914
MSMMKKPTRIALTTLALSCWAALSHAAQHPLTSISYDANRNMNVIDMVMSIDWDIDAPPAGRDKAFLESIIKQSSKSLYTMTEGRQTLGKVYVYKNSQFMDNTDIQYLLRDGRANAHVSGFMGGKPLHVQMFAGTTETPIQHGQIVAHEFGHYVHGLFDEYREVGGTSTEPGMPQDGDTPKNTGMHDLMIWSRLSTPEDYADAATRKTAQFRMFGQSAWETLVTDPAQDPAYFQTNYPKRMFFEPFRNMKVPATVAALTNPTNGGEQDLQVIYMGSADAPATTANGFAASNTAGPISMIVIDTTNKAMLPAQIHAAQNLVNNAGSNTRVAVFSYPYGHQAVVGLTRLNSDAARSSVKAQLAKIVDDQNSTDAVAADRLFDFAESSYAALFPHGPVSASGAGYIYRLYGNGQALGVKDGKLHYFDGKTISNLGATGNFLPQARLSLSATLDKTLGLMKSTMAAGDTANVLLFTSANQTVSKTTLNAYKTAKVAISPITLLSNTQSLRFASTGDEMSLFDVAKQTRGEFSESSKAGDLARVAGLAVNHAEGDNIELANEADGAMLKAGESQTVSTVVSSTDIDQEVHFSASWAEADAGNISFTLTSPAGKNISPANLPAGVRYVQTAGEAVAEYVLSASVADRLGNWKSTVTASKDTTEDVFQEVSVKSALTAAVSIMGGSNDDPRPLTAAVEVSGPLPVKGAKAVGYVYAAGTGKLIKGDIAFHDDGVAPDYRANDGHYSADLSSLPAGEYELLVKVSNDGKAVFTTANSTKKGVNAPEQPIAAFQRAGFITINKQK